MVAVVVGGVTVKRGDQAKMRVHVNDIYYFCSFPSEIWEREAEKCSVSDLTTTGQTDLHWAVRSQVAHGSTTKDKLNNNKRVPSISLSPLG